MTDSKKRLEVHEIFDWSQIRETFYLLELIRSNSQDELLDCMFGAAYVTVQTAMGRPAKLKSLCTSVMKLLKSMKTNVNSSWSASNGIGRNPPTLGEFIVRLGIFLELFPKALFGNIPGRVFEYFRQQMNKWNSSNIVPEFLRDPPDKWSMWWSRANDESDVMNRMRQSLGGHLLANALVEETIRRMMTFLVDVCLFLCLESFSFERSDDLSVAPKATFSYQPKSSDSQDEYLEERFPHVLSTRPKETGCRKRKKRVKPIRDDSGVLSGCDDDSSVHDSRPRLTRRRLVSTSKLPVAPPRFPTLSVRSTTAREIFQSRPNDERIRTEELEVETSEELTPVEPIPVREEVEMERETDSDEDISTCENQESVDDFDDTSAVNNETTANLELDRQQEFSSASPETAFTIRDEKPNIGPPKNHLDTELSTRLNIEEPKTENNAINHYMDPHSMNNEISGETTGVGVTETSYDISLYLLPKTEPTGPREDLSRISSPPTLTGATEGICPLTQPADHSIAHPPLASPASPMASRQCQCSSLTEPLAQLILNQLQQLGGAISRIERRLDEVPAVPRETERLPISCQAIGPMTGDDSRCPIRTSISGSVHAPGPDGLWQQNSHPASCLFCNANHHPIGCSLYSTAAARTNFLQAKNKCVRCLSRKLLIRRGGCQGSC